jgi:sulfur carrier protein ThiS
VGTAVNADFVARGARANHALRDGDAVATFVPITGG